MRQIPPKAGKSLPGAPTERPRRGELAGAARAARRAGEASAELANSLPSVRSPAPSGPRRAHSYPLYAAPGPRSCDKCGEQPRWGHSPLCAGCLREADLLVSAAGVPTNPLARHRGELWAARYRYRPVKCGKRSCRSCPHAWYCYRVWRADGEAKETYLGVAERQGDPYERPRLRRRSAQQTKQ